MRLIFLKRETCKLRVIYLERQICQVRLIYLETDVEDETDIPEETG